MPGSQRLRPLRDASAFLTMHGDMPGTFGCLPRESWMQECRERGKKVRGKAYWQRHSLMLTLGRAALFVLPSWFVYATKNRSLLMRTGVES